MCRTSDLFHRYNLLTEPAITTLKIVVLWHSRNLINNSRPPITRASLPLRPISLLCYRPTFPYLSELFSLHFSFKIVKTTSSMAEKSKILVIGATGYIGKFILEASVKAGNPTFALVRETTASDPAKAAVIESFKNSGVTLLYGDIYDHESLVKAIKQVDVVIAPVGNYQLADQGKIIAAIKEAGNIKRYLPSEFGNDVDRSHAVEPAKSAFATKAQIRREVEASGIPYTFVSSNFFAGYFLRTLAQPGANAPPRDKVVILGDGNPKAIFVKEEDIATYTIKAVEDPRALNKILYIRPADNVYSFNDLVSLWEKKIGKTLERIYVPEEQVLKNIEESPMPLNVVLAICHAVFIKGDHTNFEIEPSFGVEATQLFPDVKYTTVEEYLSQFA